ncbi:3-oxoacyl-[acyl-carrier-protein] synthase III C-terminal domain-containing protein [Algirhabdus cladophorae]|uniref:3-oxoacyl-[acyl-carrier-protein] synthase III C-terminal domain-containing protein n=1 Tax=Algirhabdus cladophorae TaxID=3377108 RepID=UPI003B84B041
MQQNTQIGLKVLGTGRALPCKKWLSTDLDKAHGYPEGTLEGLTGVTSRYLCDAEGQIDLAQDAAQKALRSAGLGAQDIDVVLSTAAVAYQSIPAMAPLIQRRLGIADGRCFAADVNATCLGFPTALHMAAEKLQLQPEQNILIVAAEQASRGLPWDTRPQVAGLFGDGAGAAVVSGAHHSGLLAAKFATYPSAYEACSLAAGGTRFDFQCDPQAFAAHSTFDMDAKALFRLTAKHFGGFVEDLLAMAQTQAADIKQVIAHQASPAGLNHLTRICGFDPAQVLNIASDFGNQIAASIPFALDYAVEHGHVRTGDRIALLGTSAGVSFGGLVMDF